jgi:ligand-binding SRPBCC domain-containing protein
VALVISRVEQVSSLAAPAEGVWARAVTEEGINHELRPWLRMTMPPGLRGRTIDDIEPGMRAGRSWILLFGLLPVDYDDLGIAELEPGRRFLERSTMLSMRFWEHERVVDSVGEDACTITDRLAFELRRPLARIPGSERLARAIVAALFRHRHRRLAAHLASGA